MSKDTMIKKARYLLSAVIIALFFMVMKLLDFLPYLRCKVEKAFQNLSTLEKHQFDGCIFTWEMYKTVMYDLKQDIFKTAVLGKHAPDAYLFKIQLDGEFSEVSENYISERKYNSLRYDIKLQTNFIALRCLMRPGVPLVLNFGSCSWPPFMAKLQKFRNIVKDYNGIADFAVVYIEEAHPSDGWFFKVCFRTLLNYNYVCVS